MKITVIEKKRVEYLVIWKLSADGNVYYVGPPVEGMPKMGEKR
jgi:hypothetical protein